MSAAKQLKIERLSNGYSRLPNGTVFCSAVRLADRRDPVREVVDRLDAKFREPVANILSAIAIDLDITAADVTDFDEVMQALELARNVVDQFRTRALPMPAPTTPPPLSKEPDDSGSVPAVGLTHRTGASRQGERSMQTVINLAAHAGRNTTEKLMSYLRAQNPTRRWQHAELLKAAGSLRRRSDVRIVDSTSAGRDFRDPVPRTLGGNAPVVNLTGHAGRNTTERLMSYVLSQSPHLTHFEALNTAKQLRRTHRLEGV